jgi:hypothetical protein
MIDIEKLHDDVFNPEESDLEYAQRRRRELGLDEGEKRFPLEEAVAVATKFVGLPAETLQPDPGCWFDSAPAFVREGH